MNDDNDSFGMPASASPVPTPEIEELERDVASLRSTLACILAGLLLLSLAVNAFIWRQVRIVRSQLQEERNQVAKYQKIEPNIQEFVKRLQNFAVAHPDFRPVLLKYGAAQQLSSTNPPAQK